MSMVLSIASWAATAYLTYNFYHTARYVYSLWTPPTCDPLQTPGQCFCGSFNENTLIHFQVYLSNKGKLSHKFESSSQYKQIYSSISPPSPIKLSFDSKPIKYKTYINGMDKLYKLHENKSSVYAHIISYHAPKKSSSLPSDSIFSYHSLPITYIESPPPNTFKLNDMSLSKPSDTNKLVDRVQYFQPNLTIFYVVDFNCYPLNAIPHDVFYHLKSKRFTKSNKRNPHQTV